MNASHEGQIICFKGYVIKAKDYYGGGYYYQYRIYFSEKPNTFFLMDELYRYPNLMKGTCLTAIGVVKLDSTKTPFISVNGQLFDCE